MGGMECSFLYSPSKNGAWNESLQSQSGMLNNSGQKQCTFSGGRTRNGTIVSQAFVIQDAKEALNLDDTVLEAIRLPDMISRRTSHKLTLIR